MRKFKNVRKFVGHLRTITKHKILVGKYCFKMGLYKQGINHDWSKYSPVEFFNSFKYYQGTSSAIDAEKKDKGYSMAWQHHHNKNPHHWEYWIDYKSDHFYPVRVPFKYVLEMAADFIAAGKVYKGKAWTTDDPIIYHVKTRDSRLYHPDTQALLFDIFRRISVDKDVNKTLKTIKKKRKVWKTSYDRGLYKHMAFDKYPIIDSEVYCY